MRWLRRALIALVGLVVALVILTRPPIPDTLLGWLTGSVATRELAIGWGGRITAEQVALRDAKGTYARFQHVLIRWAPLQLLHGAVAVSVLSAQQADILRLPVSSSAKSSGGTMPIAVGTLELHRLELAPPVLGAAAVLQVEGSGLRLARGVMAGRLRARSIGGANGTYAVSLDIDPAAIQATVRANEAPGGLIARRAGLPALGRLTLDASVRGPRTHLATKLALSAGPARARAAGVVNLTDQTADLTVDAQAPAMTPRPGMSWQSIALNARVRGAFASPQASGRLVINGVAAAGGQLRQVALNLAGNKGEVEVSGALDGIVLPGAHPHLLAAAPLLLRADIRLAAPDRPLTFSLHHPLLAVTGRVETKGTERGTVQVALPRLAPIAAVAGLDLQGHLALTASAQRQGETTQVSLDGRLGITGGMAPMPALVGPAAHLQLTGSLHGEDLTLAQARFDGQTLTLAASGTATSRAVALTWSAALANLGVINPALAGVLHGRGRVDGPTQDLTFTGDLAGEVSRRGQASGPVTAQLRAHGLPSAPSGQITAQGDLLGAPLQLAASGSTQPHGALRVTIQHAAWKSASVQGEVTLPPGTVVPLGQLQLNVAALADFAPLVGRSLSGAVHATLDSSAGQAVLGLAAHDIRVPGTAAIRKVVLQARVANPATHPVVNARLELSGVAASHVEGGAAQVAIKGPIDALGVTLSAAAANLDGAAGRLTTAGTVNVAAKSVALAGLSLDWRQLALRLLTPASVSFANGIDIHRLRLGVQRAVIAVDGHVGSTLNLTASLRDLPLSLADQVSPGLRASGTLATDVKLAGPVTAPTGTVRVQASGLRLQRGGARNMPPLSLTATATLQGTAARIDARMTAGTSHLTLTGRAPLKPGAPIALSADGAIDLALANPFLGAQGSVAGIVRLAADITGTTARPGGTVRVNASGIRLLTPMGRGLPRANLVATAALQGTAARIDATLSAGPSRVRVAGTAPLTTSGPLGLQMTGRVDLAMLNPLLEAEGEYVAGTVTIAAAVGGTAMAPRATGTAQLSGGDIRDYAEGVHVSSLAARVTASGDVLRIDSLTARAGKGSIGASGTIGIFQPGMPVDLTLTARNATPLSGGMVTATLNYALTLRGQLSGQLALGGTVDIGEAVIQIPAQLSGSVATIPIRIAGRPPPPARHSAPMTIALNVTVRAPQQVWVRGRGLNAELGGTIAVGGTTAEIVSRGAFKLIRGTFNLVGSTLTFSSGAVDFNGGSLTNPAIRFVAMSIANSTVATLTISGTAQAPKITLSSQPELPQDQILALLLFQTNTGSLTPLQAATIASGLAQISGAGGNLANPLESVQNALGLDQLGVGSSANGSPTLQAGRYIGRRLYVGVQQSTGGTGSQAVVQYNLTRRLKLNATAGSGTTTTAIGATGESNGESVGVTYQFQY